jgi:hypothetical protein
MDRQTYSDKSFTDRFLASEENDELETAHIDSQVSECCAKVLNKYANTAIALSSPEKLH